MAVVGIKKLILQDRLHTSSFEGFLLRYYEQIITGIWAYMVLEFIESSIYMFLGMTTEATYLTALYFVLLGIVTVVFFLSSINPVIKNKVNNNEDIIAKEVFSFFIVK